MSSDDEAPEEFGVASAIAAKPSTSAAGKSTKATSRRKQQPVIKIAPLSAEVLAALSGQASSESLGNTNAELEENDDYDDSLEEDAARRRRARARARQRERNEDARASQPAVVRKKPKRIEV